MDRRLSVWICCCLAAAGFATELPAADPIPPRVRVLLPAYFYPSEQGLEIWKTVFRSATKAPIVAIVNPDSGPGKQVDPNYRKVCELSRSSRATLIGYVTLSYAKRPVEEVKAEIDRWLEFYPEIRGIFLDEQPSSVEHRAFVEECFAYAHQKTQRGLIVSNPGVVCAPPYFESPTSPVICLFEHFQGFADYKLPEWADVYPPNRFATLHYRVTSAEEMRKRLQAAVQQRSGYVYITDRDLPNPWDGLPKYWLEEVDEVFKFNQLIEVPNVPVRKQ